MMNLRDCLLRDEQFTHLSPENVLTVINVSALQRHLAIINPEVEFVDFPKELCDIIESNHVIEAAHLARLKPEDLKRPVLFLLWPDGTRLLVDGNNRAVYASRVLGEEKILAYMIGQDVWSKFVMDIEPLRLNLHECLRIAIGREIPHDVVITIGRY